MNYKGFIANKKKGNLTSITSNDVFVVEKPTQVTKSVTDISVEVNPNVPEEKIVTIYFSDGSSLSDTFIDNEGNDYSHPLKSWVNKTNLSGAQVIANITIDALGHPTNWTVRSLTAADIGASSIGHTHNYENPLTFVGQGATSVNRTGNTITITSAGNTYTHPAKTWVDKTALTGAAVISNISVDALGHPTNWTTRTLTPSDIGAAATSHNHDFQYDNYQFWNLRTNAGPVASVYSGQDIDFKDGDLIKVSRTNRAIKIDKTPKLPYDISGGSSFSFSSLYSTRWLVVGAPDSTGNATLFITAGTGSTIGDEIEGVWNGTGRLTIVGSSGLTLLYADEFFTNTYPSGGVFGIKLINPTTAALFGKQIPIGL